MRCEPLRGTRALQSSTVLTSPNSHHTELLPSIDEASALLTCKRCRLIWIHSGLRICNKSPQVHTCVCAWAESRWIDYHSVTNGMTTASCVYRTSMGKTASPGRLHGGEDGWDKYGLSPFIVRTSSVVVVPLRWEPVSSYKVLGISSSSMWISPAYAQYQPTALRSTHNPIYSRVVTLLDRSM